MHPSSATDQFVETVSTLAAAEVIRGLCESSPSSRPAVSELRRCILEDLRIQPFVGDEEAFLRDTLRRAAAFQLSSLVLYDPEASLQSATLGLFSEVVSYADGAKFRCSSGWRDDGGADERLPTRAPPTMVEVEVILAGVRPLVLPNGVSEDLFTFEAVGPATATTTPATLLITAGQALTPNRVLLSYRTTQPSVNGFGISGRGTVGVARAAEEATEGFFARVVRFLGVVAEGISALAGGIGELIAAINQLIGVLRGRTSAKVVDRVQDVLASLPQAQYSISSGAIGARVLGDLVFLRTTLRSEAQGNLPAVNSNPGVLTTRLVQRGTGSMPRGEYEATIVVRGARSS